MKKFKNIKKKEAAFLILSCLSMSSAQAMDDSSDPKLTKFRKSSVQPMEDQNDTKLTNFRKSSVQPMEEMAIDKKITNLIKPYEIAKKLYDDIIKGCMSPKELKKTLHVLYGKSDTFLCFPWNDRGLLNNLWETQTVFKSWHPGYQEEVPGELQGLSHRMARTNNPQERKRISELHTKTLQFVTEAILQSEPNVIRKALHKDEIMKQTYDLQQKHMKEIYTHKDDYDWLSETKNHDYRSWFERPLKLVYYPRWPATLRVKDLSGLLEKNEIGITRKRGGLHCFFIKDEKCSPDDEVELYEVLPRVATENKRNYFEILGQVSAIIGGDGRNHPSISLTDRKDFEEENRINLINWVSDFFPHYRNGNSPQNKAHLLKITGELRSPAPLPSSGNKMKDLGHDEQVLAPDHKPTTPSHPIVAGAPLNFTIASNDLFKESENYKNVTFESTKDKKGKKPMDKKGKKPMDKKDKDKKDKDKKDKSTKPTVSQKFANILHK